MHSFVLIFWCCEIVSKVQVRACMAIFKTVEQLSCEKKAMVFSATNEKEAMIMFFSPTNEKEAMILFFYQLMRWKLWYCFLPNNEMEAMILFFYQPIWKKTHIAPCRANRDHGELFKTICSTRTLCLWDNMLRVIIFNIISY